VSSTGNRFLRVAAYAVITDQRGRLLLCRLSDVTDAPGSWTLPGGGVEHGEHPRDTVVREVQEETGLRVAVGALLDVDSVHRPADDDHADVHAIRVIYRAVADDPAAPLVMEQDGSTDEARWFGFDELDAVPLVDLARSALAVASAAATGLTAHS
jgi:8-oxo-dGTP diphosphatase